MENKLQWLSQYLESLQFRRVSDLSHMRQYHPINHISAVCVWVDTLSMLSCSLLCLNMQTTFSRLPLAVLTCSPLCINSLQLTDQRLSLSAMLYSRLPGCAYQHGSTLLSLHQWQRVDLLFSVGKRFVLCRRETSILPIIISLELPWYYNYTTAGVQLYLMLQYLKKRTSTATHTSLLVVYTL